MKFLKNLLFREILKEFWDFSKIFEIFEISKIPNIFFVNIKHYFLLKFFLASKSTYLLCWELIYNTRGTLRASHPDPVTFFPSQSGKGRYPPGDILCITFPRISQSLLMSLVNSDAPRDCRETRPQLFRVPLQCTLADSSYGFDFWVFFWVFLENFRIFKKFVFFWFFLKILEFSKFSNPGVRDLPPPPGWGGGPEK